MKTIPVIAGLLIILGSIAVGVGTVRYQSSKKVLAAENYEPQQVKITNVSDSGFSVSWTTSLATTGYILYGDSETNLQMKTVDDRDKDRSTPQSYFIHYTTLLGLKPENTYYFKIGSGDQEFDLSGNAYKAVVGKILTDQPPADAAYGQIVTENNDPAEGTIVYLQIPGAGLLSTLTKTSGAWAIPLATARNEKLDSYVSFDRQKQNIAVWVESGNLGSASANILGSLASPVPTITLGKIYDFVAAKNSTTSTISKFETEKIILPTSLKLLSPMDSENVSTDNPVILGSAPPGTKISIEVNSETTITGEVIADTQGNFTFQVPQNLTEGEHIVTISALVNGVLKTIKKSFVVSAQSSSSPYYTATPSATLKPTPSPTKAPNPTVTPKPSVIALTPTTNPTPTIKPIATQIPTATPKLTVIIPSPTIIPEIPKSGNLGLTGILALIGASLMLVGYTLGNDKKRAKDWI